MVSFVHHLVDSILLLPFHPTILDAMNLRFRNTVALFIVAAYVLAGVLLEVAHHDVHDIVLDAVPTLSSHDCGPNEIHIPMDKRHECLACSLTTSRIATTATHFSVNSDSFLCLGYVLDTHERTLHTDILHSGKRGPPQS